LSPPEFVDLTRINHAVAELAKSSDGRNTWPRKSTRLPLPGPGMRRPAGAAVAAIVEYETIILGESAHTSPTRERGTQAPGVALENSQPTWVLAFRWKSAPRRRARRPIPRLRIRASVRPAGSTPSRFTRMVKKIKMAAMPLAPVRVPASSLAVGHHRSTAQPALRSRCSARLRRVSSAPDVPSLCDARPNVVKTRCTQYTDKQRLISHSRSDRSW